MLGTLKKYLLPGLIFQSVVIAGGYGTGRELAEFFLTFGPRGGLLAMLLVSTVIWSAVCAVSFEFARLYATFDYKSFFERLLGPGWFLFEILYFLQLLLVLAVIAAAAGSILQETFNLPYALGVVGMMSAVGILVFRGSGAIEKFLASWSILLYAVYIVFFAFCFWSFGDKIVASFSLPALDGWALGGVRYAAYNLAVVPAVFFALSANKTSKEAIGAGLLAGPIAILPGLLFFLSMTGQYDVLSETGTRVILERAVPANMLLEVLGSRTLQVVFQVVLFGTLIETGTGMIHAINERVAKTFQEKQKVMPKVLRPALAIGLVSLGAILARFGIVDLIARGYGTLTWGFLLVFVFPILTIGLYRITRKTPRENKTMERS